MVDLKVKSKAPNQTYFISEVFQEYSHCYDRRVRKIKIRKFIYFCFHPFPHESAKRNRVGHLFRRSLFFTFRRSPFPPSRKTRTPSYAGYFIECALAYTFWKMFKIWWKYKTKQEIYLQAAQILYGILHVQSSENGNLINHLLIIAKYYIFSSYARDEHFTF